MPRSRNPLERVKTMQDMLIVASTASTDLLRALDAIPVTTGFVSADELRNVVKEQAALCRLIENLRHNVATRILAAYGDWHAK